MTQGQHLALGLILAILLLQWVLPDKNGRSKLFDIVTAATGVQITGPQTSPVIKLQQQSSATAKYGPQ